MNNNILWMTDLTIDTGCARPKMEEWENSLSKIVTRVTLDSEMSTSSERKIMAEDASSLQ